METGAGDSKARILVVDDDLFMRKLLCAYLEPEGYAVETASDGLEAWKLLESAAGSFDVLVTDREMPNMNGMELLARVRQDERFSQMPVIFQTSLTSDKAIVEGINAGVFHYLTKPYEQKVLVALIEAAIDDARRYRHLQQETRRYDSVLSRLTKGEFRFRTVLEAHEMSVVLAQISCNPEPVATGLSELLLNAVEHGNLDIGYEETSELVTAGRWRQEVDRRLQMPEYRNKYVSVIVLRKPNRTTFKITDQGKGFDFNRYMEFDPARAMDVHGRGIAMSRKFSFTSLRYLGNGNQVEATIERE